MNEKKFTFLKKKLTFSLAFSLKEVHFIYFCFVFQHCLGLIHEPTLNEIKNLLTFYLFH